MHLTDYISQKRLDLKDGDPFWSYLFLFRNFVIREFNVSSIKKKRIMLLWIMFAEIHTKLSVTNLNIGFLLSLQMYDSYIRSPRFRENRNESGNIVL